MNRRNLGLFFTMICVCLVGIEHILNLEGYVSIIESILKIGFGLGGVYFVSKG